MLPTKIGKSIRLKWVNEPLILDKLELRLIELSESSNQMCRTFDSDYRAYFMSCNRLSELVLLCTATCVLARKGIYTNNKFLLWLIYLQTNSFLPELLKTRIQNLARVNESRLYSSVILFLFFQTHIAKTDRYKVSRY